MKNIFLIILLLQIFNSNTQKALEDKPFIEYVTYLKYPVEEHFVETSDGYILRIFRIQAKNQNNFERLPVVFLQHGFADSSDDFILNKEEWAPGFYFANKGFDVWIGNSRGNKHSRNHTKLNPNKDDAFWNFSLDELAFLDLPVVFKYINKKTNEKINFIGHSQGSTILIMALAQKLPDVVNNIKKHLAFGPVVFLQHVESPLMKIIKDNYIIDKSMDLLKNHVKEIMVPNYLQDIFISNICGIFRSICQQTFEKMIELVAEFDTQLDNLQRTNIYLGHYPGGTSFNVVRHWHQLSNLKEYKLNKFDYGFIDNLNIYGKTNPPNYNFNNIDYVPTYIYLGFLDRLGTIADCKAFVEKLKFDVKQRIYPMGHLTFLWGIHTKYFLDDVYQDIMSIEENEVNRLNVVIENK